jgi:hypothetical protein
MSNKKIDFKTWEEFRESKLLWWVNRSLHLFGWAIVLETNNEGNIIGARPAKVSFRGFSEDVETKNFVILTKYLTENLEQLPTDDEAK